MEYEQAKQKFIDTVNSLEGRDLMYFLIQDCMGLNPEQNSKYYYVLQNIEGDAITSFLADNLSDRLVKNFIKEEINDWFYNRLGKMRDYFQISKEEFLASYSYVSEAEYDAT